MENYNYLIQVGLLPSRMKVWVTLSGKSQLAEVVTEGKGNIEWIVEEGIVNTGYDHMNSYGNKDCNHHEHFLLLL